MTQTRSFLLVLWLVLAFFLWDAWQKDYNAPRFEPAAGTPAAPASSDSSIPGVPTSGATPAAADTGVPAIPGAVATPPADAAAPAIAPVVLQNDVLRVNIDSRGGTLLSSELLGYRQTPAKDSPPVQLLSQDPAHWFVAQTGWVSAVANGAPAHEGAFRAETGSQTLADGGNTVETVFTWTGDNGVTVRRTWSLTRGEYVLGVRDDIVNAGSAPWQGHVYRQLQRVPPPSKGGGMTNPEAYSFVGAAVYSPQDKFEKLAFDDFVEEPVKKTVAGGWIAMLQHYFVTAWIPSPDDTVELSTGVSNNRYLTRAMGPAVSVAPGAQASNTARLYVGPKLRNEIETLAPGLGLTLDYGIFTVIAQPLHWLLSWLHSITGNWGWAIVLLVVIIKGLLFKLSEAQYKSFAKMRRVQPRIEALKERYGDDKQKFQMAMMELYKKEKINPMGGCLPMLVQIPIFIALYWVLLEAVELRHAPWILWIHNLTAPDPYFVLPALNLLTMWLTQKLSPTPGMDPLQKKMMQVMPLVFGVMFAFFPAGLVLYWATNGALGLLQQYIITRRHGEPAKPA